MIPSHRFVARTLAAGVVAFLTAGPAHAQIYRIPGNNTVNFSNYSPFPPGSPNYGFGPPGGTSPYYPGAFLYNPSNQYMPVYPPGGFRSYRSLPAEAAASITLKVPSSDAEVFFDQTRTKQKGLTRLFTTPLLPAGEKFSYQVRVRWDRDGQAVTRTRQLVVEAGQRLTVDFTAAGAEKEPAKTGQGR